jgi:glycosyltransferase involved in cell wall biosynthesis
VGWLVQHAGVRLRQRAFCFAQLTARRLREEGVRGEVTVLEGEYDGPLEARAPRPADALVLFAGRHIPEKRAAAVVPAVAAARARLPGLQGLVFGDGPERDAVLAAIAEHGLRDVVHAPGFVSAEEVDAAMARALCLLLPSSREGYGMVVIEASAVGTPSIVVAAPDNAAVELVEEGVNGTVAADASPAALAAAIERVHAGGDALRASTADWFARNAQRLSLASSLDRLTDAYRAGAPAARS